LSSRDPPDSPNAVPTGIVTRDSFGCLVFKPFADPAEQEIRVIHQAEPWQVWEMVPCPNCRAVGSAGDAACERCAGTGQVRCYADGHVADERTREHPREAELRKERERQALTDEVRTLGETEFRLPPPQAGLGREAELAALEAMPEPPPATMFVRFL